MAGKDWYLNCVVRQSTALNSSLLPSFFLRKEASSKNKKASIFKSSAAVLEERTFKKLTLFQVTTICKWKTCRTLEQLYSEGSNLNCPFFEPAKKAFEQPWNHSSWAETLQTRENLLEYELNCSLCLYFLNATEDELLFTPGPKTANV